MNRGSQKRSSGNSVFVGNITYDVAEDQVRELFERVGPVVNMRLMREKETGRSKGYGFIEYADIETAQSAARNLNGAELSGRALRVKLTGDQDGGGKGEAHTESIHHMQPPVHSAPMGAPPVMHSSHNVMGGPPPRGPPPPYPPGGQLGNGDPMGMSLKELYDIMCELQAAVKINPGQARDILVKNPQLSRALFMAQVRLGMVRNPEEVKPHRTPSPAPAFPPQGPPPNQPAPPIPSSMQPPQYAAPQIQQVQQPPPVIAPQYPGAQPPPAGMPAQHMLPPSGNGGPGFAPGMVSVGVHPGDQPMGGGMMGHPGTAGAVTTNMMPPMNTPQPSGPPVVPPQPSLPPMTAAPAATPAASQQQALLQQVLAMPPEKIATLAPEQRQQVERLRLLAQSGQL